VMRTHINAGQLCAFYGPLCQGRASAAARVQQPGDCRHAAMSESADDRKSHGTVEIEGPLQHATH